MPSSTVRKRIARFTPWVITVCVVAAVLYRYPLDQIAREMQQGDALGIVPYAVGLPLIMIFTITTWDLLVMRPNLANRLGYWDLLRAKAGASLLLFLSYSFSQGGYGLWLSRKTNTNLRTTVGVIFYIIGLDLAAVCGVASLGTALGDVSLPPETRAGVTTVATAIFIGTVVVSLAGPRILPRFVSDPNLLKPWHDTPAGSFALSLAGRCFNIVIVSVMTWAAAVGFGLEIRLQDTLVYMPIILLIGSLPINVLGFGAVQAAWLLFESPEVPGTQLLAFQFLWNLMVSGAIALRGMPFVGGVMREIANAGATAEGEVVPSPTP